VIVLHHHHGATGIPFVLAPDKSAPLQTPGYLLVESADAELPFAQGAEQLELVEEGKDGSRIGPLLHGLQIGGVA